MDWPATCAVVIPCREESVTIGGLVRAVRQYLPSVLVVDDSSGDDTAARAIESGAQAIRRSGNPGKGAAIKAGVAAVLRRQYEWVMTLDGDGQHRPDDIPAFLRCAEEAGAALVVGNRMHNAAAIPWLRRRVNRWMTRRISVAAGRLLPDSQCGFRLINLKAWAALRLETDHFEIESEMLLAFVRAGYQVEFIPIQVIGKGRRSHIHPVTDTWRWFRWWNRARVRQCPGTQPGTEVAEHSSHSACASEQRQNML